MSLQITAIHYKPSKNLATKKNTYIFDYVSVRFSVVPSGLSASWRMKSSDPEESENIIILS
jgi:hypothetical protein